MLLKSAGRRPGTIGHQCSTWNTFIRHESSVSMRANLHCWTRTRIPIWVQISITEMGTVTIGDLDWNAGPSLCNGNNSCIVQCSHWVWSLESESVSEPVSFSEFKPFWGF